MKRFVLLLIAIVLGAVAFLALSCETSIVVPHFSSYYVDIDEMDLLGDEVLKVEIVYGANGRIWLCK